MRQTDGPGQLVADQDEDTPGLGELHVALYRRALEHGWLDPVQAALRLGHPLAEVDAAVHDLVRLHLLRGDPEGPDDPDGPPGSGCYLPCSPNAAAAHLTGSIEAEIRRRHREAERLRSHVMALNPVFEESWQGSYEQNPIVHLTLPDTVRSTLEQLSAGTRSEVAAAHPLLPPQQALEEGLARTTEVIGRGISMRTLYPHSVLAHRYMQQHLSRMTALGAEIRTTGQIPDRVLFFDWETAVIADSGAGAGTGAILVRDPALVGHLRRCWESSWESALPFTSSPSGTGYGSAKDSLRRSVLQLLESGMKDEVAARRLSMSTSSYRRHVTDLMNDLGAESRFQAGSFARREGWLDG